MAKIKFRPHPGALSELLKKKGMTQVDAADASRIDRKTLAKINRGEEMKLETVQNLAKKLRVPLTVFEPPTADLSDDQINNKDGAPWIPNLMLRKLDAERLAEMLKDTARIRWQLNVQVLDEKARGFLEEFEDAVTGFHKHLRIEPHEIDEEQADSLRFQLKLLKKAEDVATLMERLAEYRLTVLGADYLFWEMSSVPFAYEGVHWETIYYRSSRAVLLSVEPYGVQSRRVWIDRGSEPPKFAPNETTCVIVNGLELETEDSRKVPRKTLDDDGIPF